MDPHDNPLFVSEETDQQFPQLFPISSEIPSEEDSSIVKEENHALEPSEVNQLLKTEIDMECQGTSSNQALNQQRRLKCPECPRYSAENEEKLARHVRKVHRGENPFQCIMCDYSTYNNVRFEEHVRKHQGIKPFKCSDCKYSSASRKNLKKHEIKHKPDYPLRCKECGFIGQHRSALLAHQRTHPDLEPEVKTEVKDEDKFHCEVCSAKFDTPESLKYHKKAKQKCLDCKAILCTKKLLTLHIKVFHTMPVEKPIKKRIRKKLFRCKVCEWNSNSKAKILLHLIHHPEQKVDENIVDISILKKHSIMK